MTGSLRAALLGGWELASFESRDVDTGAVSHPLGRTPRGLIVYTGDGYMSAQLSAGPDTTDLEPRYLGYPGYLAYGGRFHVDEDAATVRHAVTISSLPELLDGPQLRHVRLAGDRLTLSTTVTGDGVTTHNTLTWRRPRR